MKKEKFLQEVNRLKGTKTNLKTHKIMLSSVDVIREALDMTYYEAQSKMVEARDIFRFDMASNLGTAEDEISFLKGKLDDLGVDYPTELIDFESEITDRESTFEEVRRRFQDMGYDALA